MPPSHKAVGKGSVARRMDRAKEIGGLGGLSGGERDDVESHASKPAEAMGRWL